MLMLASKSHSDAAKLSQKGNVTSLRGVNVRQMDLGQYLTTMSVN